MNRIASDEPDEVGIVPKPIRFWFRGREYLAGVSRSGTSIDRLIRGHGVVRDLAGEYGRAWLADPCTMALEHGLQAARLYEDNAAAIARAERRKQKAAMAEEEAAARRAKPTRW